MPTKSQRKRRAKQRRHHNQQISTSVQERRRIDRWRDGRRSELEVQNLALLELILERATSVPRHVLCHWAVLAGHAVLWTPTFRHAEFELTGARFGPAWRRLAIAMDGVAPDLDEFDDDPNRIAQRRLIELASFCEFKQRYHEARAS
jgi:hypothetical protein